MSQDFNMGFDPFDKQGKVNLPNEDNLPEEYKVSSSIRNVCFVWQDGRRKFLNYAYLVSAEYMPDDSIIELTFTSTKISLKGIKLDILHEKLLFHLPITIICQDLRYSQLSRADYCVNEITEK